jgi:hypothetical protein
MKTTELVKKAGIVKITTLNKEAVGIEKAIEIALNNVAIVNNNRIASGLICRRASKIISKKGNYFCE